MIYIRPLVANGSILLFLNCFLMILNKITQLNNNLSDAALKMLGITLFQVGGKEQ